MLTSSFYYMAHTHKLSGLQVLPSRPPLPLPCCISTPEPELHWPPPHTLTLPTSPSPFPCCIRTPEPDEMILGAGSYLADRLAARCVYGARMQP